MGRALLTLTVLSSLIGCGARTGLDLRAETSELDSGLDGADVVVSPDAELPLDAEIGDVDLGEPPEPAPAETWMGLFERPEDAELRAAVATADGGALLLGAIRRRTPPGQRLWLVRLHQNGGVWWQREFFGGDGDLGLGLIETRSGDLVVVGETESFGALETADGWILRLNRRGEPLWQLALGGGAVDRFRDVVETPEGGLVAVGVLGTGPNRTEAWIAAFSSGGELEWQERLGDIGFNEATTIDIDGSGELYVVGLYDAVGDPNGRDLWVIKLAPGGALRWQRVYALGDATVSARGAGLLDDGRLAVTAGAHSGLASQWVLAVDPEHGGARWQRLCSDSLAFDDAPRAATLTPGGELIATGDLREASWLRSVVVDGEGRFEVIAPLSPSTGLELRGLAQLVDGRLVVTGSTLFPARRAPAAALAVLDARGSIETCDSPGEISFACESVAVTPTTPTVALAETFSEPRATTAELSASDYELELLCP